MRLVSTRDPQRHANFRQAVLAGIAPGGGLWMPEPLPVFSDWPELLDLGWSERCTVILDRLLADELGHEAVAQAVRGGPWIFPCLWCPCGLESSL